jgi:hypothetical protein
MKRNWARLSTVSLMLLQTPFVSPFLNAKDLEDEKPAKKQLETLVVDSVELDYRDGSGRQVIQHLKQAPKTLLATSSEEVAKQLQDVPDNVRSF